MFVTIVGSAAAETVVKKSRFLTVVERVETEDAARRVVASARSAHPGAGHHCSAFLIGDIPGSRIERSRYFGGTKLRTRGVDVVSIEYLSRASVSDFFASSAALSGGAGWRCRRQPSPLLRPGIDRPRLQPCGDALQCLAELDRFDIGEVRIEGDEESRDANP